jgi:type IV fimbrial biogenesis protein FimT
MSAPLDEWNARVLYSANLAQAAGGSAVWRDIRLANQYERLPADTGQESVTSQGGNPMRYRGFTLLELLVTLLVLISLLAVGAPSLSQQIQQNRTRAATQEILGAVQLARTHAVNLNQRVTLRHLGSWEMGWEVFIDTNFNGVRDEGEQLLYTGVAVSGVRITPNNPVRNYVSFIGTGESRFAGTANAGGFQAGTFRICPQDGGMGYSLVLARSGRMRTDTLSAAECG